MEDKPLMDGSENVKRPTLLYIIIGVLIAVIIALIIVIVVKKCDECKCNCPEEKPTPAPTPNPYDESHFIPIKESFYTDKIAGSKESQGLLNHFDTPYYKMIDIYNMESNSNRTILSKFKTYQQTCEYSAQCASLIMTLDYYGDEAPSERQCMAFFGATDPDNFEATEDFYQNLTMKNFESYINSLGYTTTSNDNFDESNPPFTDSKSFSIWVEEILKKNETILVNWADWGGMCSVIIGVDTMGSEYGADRVIIFGDSYDTWDHLNDGYYVMGIDKFYENWMNTKITYFNEENQKYASGRFIVIHRKSTN